MRQPGQTACASVLDLLVTMQLSMRICTASTPRSAGASCSRWWPQSVHTALSCADSACYYAWTTAATWRSSTVRRHAARHWRACSAPCMQRRLSSTSTCAPCIARASTIRWPTSCRARYCIATITFVSGTSLTPPPLLACSVYRLCPVRHTCATRRTTARSDGSRGWTGGLLCRHRPPQQHPRCLL